MKMTLLQLRWGYIVVAVLIALAIVFIPYVYGSYTFGSAGIFNFTAATAAYNTYNDVYNDVNDVYNDVNDVYNDVVFYPRFVVYAQPGISLTKTANLLDFSKAGEEIIYVFRVTNTGNETLTGVTVTEEQFTGTGTLPAPKFISSTQNSSKGTLLPGERAVYRASYAVTQADVNAGEVYNKAAATGRSPAGIYLKSQDDEKVISRQNASISVKKATDVATYNAVGASIRYTIIVTNDGNVTLNNVMLKDDLLKNLKRDNKDFDGTIGTLAPGASVTVTGAHVVKQSDLDAGSVDNIATATGYFNRVKYEDTDQAAVQAIQRPRIKLTKTADVKTYRKEGEVINYAFKVENTGNVTLYDVRLDDPKVVLSGRPIAELAPGAYDSKTFSGTYRITRSDLLAWDVRNKATVRARDPNNRIVTDTDVAVVLADVDYPKEDLPTPPTGGQISVALVLGLMLTTGGIALKKFKGH